MALNKTGQAKAGRYQQKMKMGLVPFRYDKDSKSFLAGAHKNWPSGAPHRVINGGYYLNHPNLVAADAEYLKRAREAR